MSKFETRFSADDDADQIRSAFYGFVRRHADDSDVDGDVHISTEFDRHGPSLSVRLWSAEAMETFLAGLSVALRSQGSPCFE